MSDTKPFIFIEPLSETLQKLKEVVMETASEEGIEIFTIENMMEANQLIPTVGQSLIVCSNPKKCAALLQTNRKVISKLSSKVILLSPKVLPRKTLEKFMKVGLTECVVEPVPSKTLLYKVKLLLRSISSRKEEGDMEMRSIKGDDEAPTNTNEKQRLEKGIISEESPEERLQRERKQSEALEADYDLNARSEKKAEEIDGHWSGQLQKEREQAQKKKERELEEGSVDYLESHYKGKLNTSLEEEDEEETNRKKANSEIEIDYDDFKEAPQKEPSFDVDSLRAQKKKNGVKEKEGKDLTSEGTKEKIETHYKGKIGEFKIDEEEYGELTAGTDIELDFTPEEKERSKESSHEDEDDEVAKKNQEIDLDFDEKKAKKTLAIEEEEDEKRREQAVELDLSENDRDRHQNGTDQKAKKDPHTGEVDHIETMLKGHLDHTRPEQEEEDDYKDTPDSITLSFEDKTKGNEETQEDEEEDFYDRDKINLEFTDTPDYKKEKLEEDSEDIYEREATTSSHSTQSRKRESPKDQTEEDEDETERRGTVQLELVESADRKRAQKSEDEDDFLRTKKVDAKQENERERSPIDAHAEHIQTYYKSGEGIKHVDDNWDNKYERPRRSDEDDSGARDEKILQMLTKENLGEQTIDYRRLKEQFDAISIGIDGKLKMADVLITDSGGGKKRKGPRYYREDIVAEDATNENEEEQEEDELKNQIFSPTPGGLDFVIKMSNLFQSKELKEEDYFNSVAELLWEKFGAHCCFFIRRPEKSEYEIAFQKQIEGADPESPQAQFSISAAMENKFETWALMSLPYWLDHTFQTDNQMFFFPYTEGAQKIGFATVHFFNKVEEQIASEVEVILESVRGVYLQAFHKTGLEGSYNQEKVEEPKKKTLLSKMMFWKKAG